MKLIFIINNAKFIGGGDYSIFKFAEHLASRGHDVTIFTSVKNAFTSKLANKKNLSIMYSGSVRGMFKGAGIIDRVWDKVYTKIVLEQFIGGGNIDFIIGYHRIGTIKTQRLAKKFNVPSAVFVFETPDWMASRLNDRWFRDYHGRFKKSWIKTKKALEKVNIIIPNSKLTGIQNEKWLNRKIESPVYPGLDTKIPDSLPEFKKENQIIYLGRLNAYKNIDILIKSLSEIKNAPKLVLCGDGEEKNNLIELANSLKINCEFKGTIGDNEKWMEIKKSLFMVFPSSFEGFGMPPMEALYCEIPCICSDIPIFHEVYKDRVEYFQEGNIKELAEKIKYLLNNPKYRSKRGKEGKFFIKTHYSWSKSAEKIEKLLSGYKNGNRTGHDYKN